MNDVSGLDRCACGAFLPSVGSAAWEPCEGLDYNHYGEVETRCLRCGTLYTAYDLEVITPGGRATGKTFAFVRAEHCSSCGAQPGQSCRTPSGLRAFPHADRIKVAKAPSERVLTLVRGSMNGQRNMEAEVQERRSGLSRPCSVCWRPLERCWCRQQCDCGCFRAGHRGARQLGMCLRTRCGCSRFTRLK